MPQMYTEVKRLGEKELSYMEKFKRMVLSAATVSFTQLITALFIAAVHG